MTKKLNKKSLKERSRKGRNSLIFLGLDKEIIVGIIDIYNLFPQTIGVFVQKPHMNLNFCLSRKILGSSNQFLGSRIK